MQTLKQGQIVWATVLDEDGKNPKKRPVVIISPSEDVPLGEPLLGVCVSTRFHDLDPGEYVELPWNVNKYKVRTRLTQRCAAVCNWRVEISASDIAEVAGVVPGLQLEQIIRKVIEEGP